MKKAVSRGKNKLDRHSAKTLKAISKRNLAEESLLKKQGLQVERSPTWIKGFDELVEGGIPKNFLVLVTGGPGTGKTTFAIEYLIQGALHGEKGVYVSLEEDTEKIEKQLGLFGWPVKRLEKESKLLLVKPGLYDFSKLKEVIQDTVVKFSAKRLVIDSISLLRLYFKDTFTVRRALLEMGKTLRDTGCTTIIISETQGDKEGLSRFGVEEFISDGIIFLYMSLKNGEYTRGIAVRKMRLTNHSLKKHPVSIKKNGGIIVLHSKEIHK